MGGGLRGERKECEIGEKKNSWKKGRGKEDEKKKMMKKKLSNIICRMALICDLVEEEPIRWP